MKEFVENFRLETKRLIIRGFKSEDWEDLYEYLSDPDVVRFEPYEVFNKEQAKEEAANRSKNESFFAVCLKASGKLIGNIYIQQGEFDTWELGYVFNSKYQGCGYATEAAKAIVTIAFKEWGARRIVAMCNPLNIPSWRLPERLGMRREGTLIKNVYFKFDNDGEPIWSDTYEYGLLKEEFRY